MCCVGCMQPDSWCSSFCSPPAGPLALECVARCQASRAGWSWAGVEGYEKQQHLRLLTILPCPLRRRPGLCSQAQMLQVALPTKAGGLQMRTHAVLVRPGTHQTPELVNRVGGWAGWVRRRGARGVGGRRVRAWWAGEQGSGTELVGPGAVQSLDSRAWQPWLGSGSSDGALCRAGLLCCPSPGAAAAHHSWRTLPRVSASGAPLAACRCTATTGTARSAPNRGAQPPRRPVGGAEPFCAALWVVGVQGRARWLLGACSAL